MTLRVYASVLLLCLSTVATAQVGCDRRQGWTIDGEHCPRCNIVLGGSVAKKQSFGICINCATGCPYEKFAPLGQPEIVVEDPETTLPPLNICGLLAQPPKVLASSEQIPVSLKVDATVVTKISHRYPIAATFVAVMASKDGAQNIFDAGNVTLGIRHRPREGTAEAFLERGDVAMQAPFVTELPLFEQVLVEVRGEKRASGELEWWVLSSHETRKGTRVLEGPVRIVLADTGERAAASMGNMGVLAPVMEIASVE